MPVMNYRKGTEKEKSWIIEETSFNEKYTGKCESVFTQGNGYLGLRNSLEEQYVNTVRGMFITGTFNKASKDEVTELPNVSDIVNMEIELNGERFSMNENNIKEYSRTLNLYTGETCRNVLWKGKNGDIVHLSFHRFVSYENVHVIGAYVEIKQRLLLQSRSKLQILLPEASEGEHSNINTIGFAAGFLIMMILDVALG